VHNEHSDKARLLLGNLIIENDWKNACKEKLISAYKLLLEGHSSEDRPTIGCCGWPLEQFFICCSVFALPRPPQSQPVGRTRSNK